MPTSILGAVSWPVLGSLAVHAVGQPSYPGPLLPRRLASLEVRRVRDFLPRALAWTVAATFVGSALQIGSVATLAGYEAIPFSGLEERNQRFSHFGGDGRIQGSVLAACLGAAWLVLALGAATVLTVATIAAGLTAVAGNFAARPDPSAGVSSWTNPAGFAAFVVLLVMWGWAPPKLPSVQVIGNGSRPALAESPAAAHPATRLVVSLGAAMGLAPLVAAAPGFFLPGANFPGQPAVVVVLMAAAVLLVAAAGELLLQRNYGSPGVPRTWPRQAVSPAGLIESRRRNGTVVAQPAPGGARQSGGPVPEAVTAAVDLLVNAGRDARLSDELLLDLVRGTLRRG